MTHETWNSVGWKLEEIEYVKYDKILHSVPNETENEDEAETYEEVSEIIPYE